MAIGLSVGMKIVVLPIAATRVRGSSATYAAKRVKRILLLLYCIRRVE